MEPITPETIASKETPEVGQRYTLEEGLKRMANEGKRAFLFGVDHRDDLSAQVVMQALETNPMHATKLVIEGSPQFQFLLDLAFQSRIDSPISQYTAQQQRQFAAEEIGRIAGRFDILTEYHRIGPYIEAAIKGGFTSAVFADGGNWHMDTITYSDGRQDQMLNSTGTNKERDIGIASGFLPIQPSVKETDLTPFIQTEQIVIGDTVEGSLQATSGIFGLQTSVEIPEITVGIMGLQHSKRHTYYGSDPAEYTATAGTLVDTLSGGKVASIACVGSGITLESSGNTPEILFPSEMPPSPEQHDLANNYNAIVIRND